MKVILVDAIHTFFIKDHGVFHEMHELLEMYPNRKIILTNADQGQIMQLGMNHLPYELFTLQHDPEKSDPRYYRIMLARFSLHPEDVLYVEHGEDAVKSARAVGILTHHYDCEKKDLVSVKAFLDANR